MLIQKCRSRRKSLVRRKGMGVFNCFNGGSYLQIGLSFLLLLALVMGPTQAGTTDDGFLPATTSSSALGPKPDNPTTPTPSPSKSTLNGQFPTSDTFYGSPSKGAKFSSSPWPPSSTVPPDPEKVSDMALLRKIQSWSSSRSAKLNLTEEHQALLRIEPRSNGSTTPNGWRYISSTVSTTPAATTPYVTKTSITMTPMTSTKNEMKLTLTRRPHPIRLYPEWLSTGGVYPDDNSENGTSLDYFSEPEDAVDYGDGVARSQVNPGSGFSDPGEAQEENPNRQESLLSPGFRKRIRIKNDERDDESEDFPEREKNGRGFEREKLTPTKSPQESDPRFLQVQVDSTADNGFADVISRGRIDSVKYVYFGDKYNDYHKEEVAGRIIQAVGGVVAAIAQVLTVLGAAKCIRKRGSYTTPPVQLHIGFALLISNLLLLLAVHATEPVDVCASVAVILHYLHLVIGCWLLGHTVQTYRTLQVQVNVNNLLAPDHAGTELIVPFDQRSGSTPSSTTLPICLVTWFAPIPFIITSYLVSPDGYETRSYCWMSLEKGMLVSFIVPVFLLIGLNTSLVVLSLRHLLALQKSFALEKELMVWLDGRAVSGGIRASAMLLPLLAIMWFLGVVALENPTSIFFQLTAAGANIALSWLVMYFLAEEVLPLWCPFKKPNSNLSGVTEYNNGSLTSIQPSAGSTQLFDSEPLLGASSSSSSSAAAQPGPSSGHPSSFKPWTFKNKPNWSRPGDEIYELRHDAISTICKQSY